MRLSTFRWKKRALRQEHEDDDETGGGELSLVPYLDIVTNIILFLMMTTTFTAALSNVAVAAPGHCDGERCAAAPGLSLAVQVSRAGFTIATADGVRPMLRADAGRLDFTALTREATALKAAHPAETHVVVSANPDVDYATVIAVTDALRGTPDHPLFPDVSLAAGVQ